MATFSYCVYFQSYSLKCVSCFGIWWRHDIWISEKFKFAYLKNEKSFQSEIKTFFLVSQVLYTKQTSKNVADTTFNLLLMLFSSIFDIWELFRGSPDSNYDSLIVLTVTTPALLIICP